MNAQSFLASLDRELLSFNREAVVSLCEELRQWLYSSNDLFPLKEAESILQHLRNKRHFRQMQLTADALIQTGRGSLKIRRQYAQCLIEQETFTAAEAILKGLLAELTGTTDRRLLQERGEATGLLVRVYKQIYLKADQRNIHTDRFIFEGIKLALDIYNENSSINLWQGVNAVALLCRAKRDALDVSMYDDPALIAGNILQVIEDMNEDKKAGVWEYAQAVEACIAMGLDQDAFNWLERYINARNADGTPAADAFEVGSMLRQFREVWKLEEQGEFGRQVITLLQSALLSRAGGEVSINLEDKPQQNQPAPHALEKVFGAESFETYSWYLQGADRCLSVARIGRDKTKGLGTGFLMRGAALHPSLAADILLLTNAHVLSDDPTINALRKEEACVVMEALDKEESFALAEIIFSSPPSQLDITVARFKPADAVRLQLLTRSLQPYPVATVLPFVSDTQRIYIIGHPSGGTLSMSLQDNLLLDHQAPLIHYRTPTVGGSSGSPVFNRQWELIGVHHKGSSTMPRLHGQQGVYEANEGISIATIIAELEKSLQA
ncbi:MAG: trypsin-like peptidase domain-containing protein [Williamsia sp.]|nr:trypsin-like peptidase domain-containing protein [Williamsia sp.]